MRLSIKKDGEGCRGKKKRTQNGAIFYNFGVYFLQICKTRVILVSRYTFFWLKFTSFQRFFGF